MQWIDERNIPGDVEEFQNFLKNKGIFVIHSNEYANARALHGGSTLNKGLWVVLDAQYQDALGLIRSRCHVVQNPLSAEEMEALRESAKDEFYSKSSRFFSKFFSGFLLLVLICIVGYVLVNVV